MAKGKVKKTDKGNVKDVTKETATAKKTVSSELSKNEMITPAGDRIIVRGPEKKRTGYQQGNVGWQVFLSPMRITINMALALTHIGAPDKVIVPYRKEADRLSEYLTAEHVTIPSDMVTGHAMLETEEESPVGSDQYRKSLSKLSRLVKTVSDETSKKAILNEIAGAKKALDSIK